MAEHRYEPHEIERKWQAIWESERTWEVPNEDDGTPRSHALTVRSTGAEWGTGRATIATF